MTGVDHLQKRIINHNKNAKKGTVFSYLQIIVGCILGGAAYPLFLTPGNIAPGGLTGLAMVINYLFHWPVGTVTLILNVPLFLIGWKFMGKRFVLRTLIATVLFSLLIDLLPLKPLTDDPLLSAIFGGVLLGIGLGLILRGEATTGGTDMLARMIHRSIPAISTGMFLMALDCAVVIVAAVAIGVTQALYAIICIYISSKVIDAVMIGFSGNKACFIISGKSDIIMNRILTELERGVTQLSAKGGYTGEERPTLMCVVSRMEVTAVKNVVRDEDENAFMIVVDAHEAIGDGFSGYQD